MPSSRTHIASNVAPITALAGHSKMDGQAAGQAPLCVDFTAGSTTMGDGGGRSAVPARPLDVTGRDVAIATVAGWPFACALLGQFSVVEGSCCSGGAPEAAKVAEQD